MWTVIIWLIVGITLGRIYSFLKREANLEKEKAQLEHDKKEEEFQENVKHLEWIHHRLVHEHKERENVDYMIKFKEFIKQLKGKPEL